MMRVAQRLGLSVSCAAIIVALIPGGSALGADRRASAVIQGEGIRPSSIHLTATYDVEATIKWARRRIDVRTVIEVTNTSGSAIERLELNTLAGPLANMTLLGAQVDDQDVEVTRLGQTILVPFAGTLLNEATARVMIHYRATFRTGTSGYQAIFTKADGILAAYRWIPWVSRQRKFEMYGGDAWFTPVSPHVEVTFTSDRPLVIVTNGMRVAAEGLTKTFVADNVRDFNFTAAPDFNALRGTSIDGQTPIVVFTRSGRREQLLHHARRSLDAFENRIGRYPYPRYVVSESPGFLGMETPGLSWVGADAIRRRTPSEWSPNTAWARHGVSGSWAPYLTVHETGHQWFYGIVGSDQPRQPFADEAVTEFLTRWYRGDFRASACATANLDRTVYQYPAECFYEIVYIQGSLFLNGVLRDIGGQAFWPALKGYWKAHKHGMGSTAELLEAFRLAGDAVGVDLLPRYRARFPSLYPPP